MCKIQTVINNHKGLDSYLYDQTRKELNIFYTGNSVKYEWMIELTNTKERFMALVFTSLHKPKE